MNVMSQRSCEGWLRELFERLREGDEVEREDVARILCELRLCEVNELLPYLQDPNPKVREYIVEALRATGDPSIRPHLLEALSDPSWQVQGKSLMALRQIDRSALHQVLSTIEGIPHEWVAFCLLDWIVDSGLGANARLEGFINSLVEEEHYSESFRLYASDVLKHMR